MNIIHYTISIYIYNTIHEIKFSCSLVLLGIIKSHVNLGALRGHDRVLVIVQVTSTSFSGEVVLYYLSNIIYKKGTVLIAMYNYIV